MFLKNKEPPNIVIICVNNDIVHAVVDVPEGSGPFAHVFAQAGITREMFDSVSK